MNVFFHSNISKVGDHYYGKEIFNQYLYGLAKTEKIKFVTPVVNERLNFHTEVLDDSLIEVSVLPKSILKRLSYLIKTIKNSDKSLIFMPTYTNLFVGVLSILFGKKMIIYHGTDWQKHSRANVVNRGRVKRFLYEFKLSFDTLLDNFVTSRAKVVFVTGGQIQEKYLSVNKNTIQTKPIINLNFDVPIERLSSDLFEVIFVGNLNKRKGVYDLIEAINLLKDKKINFTIIGEGEEKEKLIEIAKKYDLNERLVFKGFVKNGPDLFKEYLKSDVLILPSYSEGFPRVFYEAMYFNTAIITTAVNSIPYLLNNRETALFIDTGNFKDIAEKLTILYEDKEMLGTLKGNGKKLVDSILSEPAWKQHSSFFDEI